LIIEWTWPAVKKFTDSVVGVHEKAYHEDEDEEEEADEPGEKG
jgi:hypothetical protein